MSSMIGSPLQRETLAEQAVRMLKQQILAQSLKPGDQLPSERELARITDVSRNVIREALGTLVAEGYISKQPGRGAFVRPHDPKQLQADLAQQVNEIDEARGLSEVRAALEIGALSFIVRRITPEELARLRDLVQEMKALFEAKKPLGSIDREFHDTLIDCIKNEAFASVRQGIMRTLRSKMLAPYDFLYHVESRDAISLATAEQVVQALEGRDLEAAERAMRAHLTVTLPPSQARTFLFIDDIEIAAKRNLVRTVNQANKHHRNPLITAEYAWEGQRVFPSATVLYDTEQKEHRLWYQGYRYLSPLDEQYSLCYAVSVDGIHWQKPAVGVVEFQGSYENNLLIPWGDALRPDTMSVTVFDDVDTDDPDRRFIMVHFCHGMYPLGLGVAFSPDGLHWRPLEANPVDSGGAEPIGDVLCAMVEPGTKRTAAYYRVRLRVRSGWTLARAETSDLIHWSGHEVVLEVDEQDPPGAQLYGMTPFRYGDLILAFLWVATENGTKTEVQMACSRDGRNWERVADRQPLLPRGPKGAFDAAMVARTTAPIVFGDELWFYYLGAECPPGDQNNGGNGIGLATLTMDRFVSLDAGDEEGELTTEPIDVGQGTKLLLNAVANPGGYILVELQNQAGDPIEGYRRTDAVPFEGNAVFHTVSWQERHDLTELAGQIVRVRFNLRKARLYAFRLCPPDAVTSDLAAIVC